MRRPGFLKRLHKEAALQQVAPSDEMKSAYLKKSGSNLISARLLLDNDLFRTVCINGLLEHVLLCSRALLCHRHQVRESYGCNYLTEKRSSPLTMPIWNMQRPEGLTNSILLPPLPFAMMWSPSYKRLNPSMQNSLASSTD